MKERRRHHLLNLELLELYSGTIDITLSSDAIFHVPLDPAMRFEVYTSNGFNKVLGTNPTVKLEQYRSIDYHAEVLNYVLSTWAARRIIITRTMIPVQMKYT